jgi:hypothetical protein
MCRIFQNIRVEVFVQNNLGKSKYETFWVVFSNREWSYKGCQSKSSGKSTCLASLKPGVQTTVLQKKKKKLFLKIDRMELDIILIEIKPRKACHLFLSCRSYIWRENRGINVNRVLIVGCQQGQEERRGQRGRIWSKCIVCIYEEVK